MSLGFDSPSETPVSALGDSLGIGTRILAQSAQERFYGLVLELDTDYCQNTFGVAPCTGIGTPCYNTYGIAGAVGACVSRSNYVKGVKTFKFCERGMAIPAGETLRPYISAHSFTPSEIPLGGGLAARSNITLTLADETCTDYEADPYAATRSAPASGTFWTRFMARNYNIQGRMARLKKGYVTNPFDWTVFQTELYLILSIIGPDTQGNMQVVLTDLHKTLDQNMLPVATDGALQANLKAVENSGVAMAATSTSITLPAAASAVDGYYVGFEVYITQNTGAGQRRVITAYVGATRVATVAAWAVTPDTTSTYQISALFINVGTGLGVKYPSPAVTGLPQFVRINNEAIQYTTVSGDVLSWPDATYRAQFGTAAQDSNSGTGVQRCFAPVGRSVTDVVHAMLNGAGIPDAYIDMDGLIKEDADWYGAAATITACIHKPEKASALLNEFASTINLNIWWDAVAQKMRFKADMPQLSSTVKSITPNETVGRSMQVTPLDNLRITRSFLSFAPWSATGNMTQSPSFAYTIGNIDANAEGPNEYNGIISEQRYSRWLSAANLIFVDALVDRRINRFRDAPFKLAFSLDPCNENHLADLIDVTNRKKTDATGAPLVTRMRITKYLDNKNFDIEATSTNFGGRPAFIAPVGTPDYPFDTTYAHISQADGTMNDGTSGYTII